MAGVRDGEFDLDETGALVELDSEGHPVGRDAGGDPAAIAARTASPAAGAAESACPAGAPC